MNRHHKHRRLAALAACVGTTVTLALAGGAGPAMASVTCQSPGYGSGSSLQSAAMTTVWLTAGGWGAPGHSNCSVLPSVTYTKTASGPGLDEFGNNTGVLDETQDPTAFGSAGTPDDVHGKVLDWYVGTDDPPSQGQLSEAETASGDAHNNLEEITLPVAQSPVAVLLSLPAGCLIPSGSALDIPNNTVGQLWEGTNPAVAPNDPGGIQAQGGYAIGTWGAFLTQLGYTPTATNPPTEPGTFHDAGGATGCGQAITPQVRQTASGTSYAFKNYLNQINRFEWAPYASDYPLWPSSSVVEEDPLTPPNVGTQLNDTGSHIAGNTAANPGSVGYANPADAGANGGFTNAATTSTFHTGAGGSSAPHQILWAEVQNNGTNPVGATYADPLLAASAIANCETTKLIPSDKGYPYSYTDSWFGVAATDPNIAVDAGATDYPLCALTYDLVWKHYGVVNLFKGNAAEPNIANTVRDLMNYIQGPGQTDIQSHDYTSIPSGFAAHDLIAILNIT